MDLTDLSLVRNPGPAQRPGDGVVRLALPKDGDDDYPDLLDRDGAPLDALAGSPPPPQTPGEVLLALLVELDAWLAPYGDRPPAAAFAAWRRQALKARPQIDDAVLDAARPLLGSQIVAAVPDWATVRRLTRLVLLLELLDPRTTTDAVLKAAGASTELVFALLRRRTPLFPAGFDVAVPDPKVKLVRDAKVSDLFVVRSEWSCYLRGEIAAITNVLAHESFTRTVTLTEEEETTVTRETERIESTELTEEDRSQTEIAREVNREQALQVHAEGAVNVSGSYGLTNFAASASAGVNASLSESSRQASRIAREVLSKAVTRVESRVREERVRRTLTRSVDRTRRAIENETPRHVRGVYRWVDRIDRFQVFRYPDRLQLEFEIPEPAEYLRYRLARPAAAPPGGVDKPPAFNLAAATITAGNYAQHALTYRAGNVPPPPDPTVSVSVAASLALTGEQKEITNRTEQWTAPQLEKQLDVTIPRAYAARSVDVAATAMPKRANWRVEWQNVAPANGKFAIEGFHQITLTLTAGGGRLVHQKGSYAPFQRYAVQMSPQLGAEDRPSTYFGDAHLATPAPAGAATSIAFAQPVTDRVSLAVSLAGASSAAVSAEVKCALRPEALAEWQNTVYDLLLDAWRAWDREWRLQEQATLGPTLSPIDARSPARNLQIVVEELKRQVIAWLLDEDDFAGRDAMVPVGAPPPPWQRYSIDAARDTAPEIQFLEQGLEWGNLTYVPYPYYWARGSEWDELTAIEGADPTFAAFLRCGSARVVVPARPGFELAILHWLIYQEPFFGDPLPLPDRDLYVSVASEIRDLTRPPEDGDAGDCWETRLPTTLMWLEEDAELPQNDARRLGRAPHRPTEAYCERGADDRNDDDDDHDREPD